MANTFELISSVTVGSGGASSIDFTSIPSTYTDLVLKTSIRLTGNNGNKYTPITLAFNGSASNKTSRYLLGENGSTSSTNYTEFYQWADSSLATASTFASIDFYVPNYSGSANKSVSTDGATETNATDTMLSLGALLWSNTAAINRITLTPTTSSIAEYSTAYLYGVKNA